MNLLGRFSPRIENSFFDRGGRSIQITFRGSVLMAVKVMEMAWSDDLRMTDKKGGNEIYQLTRKEKGLQSNKKKVIFVTH